MADYISTLNGAQMDSALMDMAEHNSEAYAVGERNGIPVGQGDVTYQNNARYYAQQAQSIAPASVTEAVRWDIAQTALTDANKAQARANIDAGKNGAWSNLNLLDNAYFVGGGSQLGDGIFPINQRGQTTYSNSSYGIDRWVGNYTLNAGYLTVNGFMYQIASYPFGVPLTFSAMLADGSVVGGTLTITETTTQEYFYTDGSTIQLVKTSGNGALMVWTGSSVNIKAVKLEVGTVSTLANDPPPDFGEELRKCQRYLWCKTFPQYTQIGIGVATDASNCVIDVVLPATMRTGATITFTANVLLIGAGGAIVAASVSAINIIDNHARLNAVAASSMVTHNTYSFITSAETTMTISAEL